MRRKDRRSPERSRGNRGVAELRAEALGTGPMGRDIQDLGYELRRIPRMRTSQTSYSTTFVNRGEMPGISLSYSVHAITLAEHVHVRI